MRRKYRHRMLSYIKTHRIPHTTYKHKGRMNVLIDLKDLKNIHRTWVFNLINKINGK